MGLLMLRMIIRQTQQSRLIFLIFSESVGRIINANGSAGLAGVEGNLAVWLDASNINGQGNEGIDNGNQISTWVDLSGNGHNAVQETAAHLPIYTDSGINDFGSITFSGDTFLKGTNSLNIPGNSNLNLMVVIKPNNREFKYKWNNS